MVPADYTNFFSVMAGVGATLFGIIFLVISIKPEVIDAQNTSMRPQVQAASAYGALLNPLVISLIALIPHATIGEVACVMSAIGLVNTVIMGISLLQDSRSWAKRLKNALFIFGSTVIYGFEIYYAIRLINASGDHDALENLAILLVVIYLFGIARAWDLVGVRQFHIQELFKPLIPKRMEEFLSNTSHVSNTPHVESTKDANKQGD